jgi:myo-inositol-1(or 4)-monophosphatase
VYPDHPTVSFAINLAHRAGDLLLEHFRSGNFGPSMKSDRTVVTLADLASDRLIAGAIQEQYPGDLILSEELNPSYHPNDFQKGIPSVWVVDPLDGTTNFSLGLHFWGVLLARLVNGWPETSVMYFPLIDEMYVAQRGAGAFFNEKPLTIQPPSTLSPLSFFACCSRTQRNYQVSIPYKTRILGSTAYTLCTVARSIAIVGFEATPKIWDLAAPWLLVSEAGGTIESYVQDLPPLPLRPGIDYARQSFPILAAATPGLAERSRQQIIAK